MDILFEIVRYATMIVNMVQACRRSFYSPGDKLLEYYLSYHGEEWNSEDTIVPKDCVYVCEYLFNDKSRKAIVQYEGEVMKKTLTMRKGKTPWIWIGDITAERELTSEMQKFIVHGNVIKYELLNQLMDFHIDTQIRYMDSTSLEFKDFPEDGIVIEEDDSV
jgi:hypothetical protein